TNLARGGVGAVVTGFTFISQTGRAMQPRQCGLDSDDKIPAWTKVIKPVLEYFPDVRFFAQLAHTGRQTRKENTGLPVVGVTTKRCSYFRQRVRALDDRSIEGIILEFAEAARRAKAAGFHGVQVHGAHGYLVHQFLSPRTNTRKDRWSDGPLFLEKIVAAIRKRCGEEFPILVKLSAAEDCLPGLKASDTIQTVNRLDALQIDAVEVSYGTMEYALNIVRGKAPISTVLETNPLFNRIPSFLRKALKLFFLKRYLRPILPFEEGYNLASAETIKRETTLPVIAVGGIRSAETMIAALTRRNLDGISLCRPLIREPDLPAKIRKGLSDGSSCTQCNLCLVYCDSHRPVRCYGSGKENDHENR
ncbi:MAG: NADH:flavin oxidoreductase, partial [Planctomycetes bacterium]|nr:NADH:flavin oxidoreductase [Planctomycetota bacterium]